MKALRALLLGACALAVPVAIAGVHANAAEPSPQQVVLYDFAGHPVAVLTPLPAGAPHPHLLHPAAAASLLANDPFAQMDAMMDAMMARMNTFAALPFAGGAGAPMTVGLPGGPGQMFISTFSSGGHGTCSQTVTYRSDGTGQPKVDVSQTGDACAAIARPGGQSIPAALPEPQPETVAPVATPGQRLYNIDYHQPVKGKRALHG